MVSETQTLTSIYKCLISSANDIIGQLTSGQAVFPLSTSVDSWPPTITLNQHGQIAPQEWPV